MKMSKIKFNYNIVSGMVRMSMAGSVFYSCVINGGALGYSTIWACIGTMAILHMFIATDMILKGYGIK